jgi:kinesin family protein 2/24
MKIDGITKYVEDHEFYFDNVFGDHESTENVYNYSILPSINLIMNRGTVTCFAYGQTGSGKTHTMKGIQNSAIDSIFNECGKKSSKKFEFFISFFEIYGGMLYDLLNNREKLSVLEDKNQTVQIFGLEEIPVTSPEQMKTVVELANNLRTTHNTVTNETSSRSHAICNVNININIF